VTFCSSNEGRSRKERKDKGGSIFKGKKINMRD
jgi:hypothetical protein